MSNIAIIEKERNMIFGEGLEYIYWLASRAILVSSRYAFFGPGWVDSGYADNYRDLFRSSGSKNCSSGAIRPVVSII